jgi:chaperonin cofactor prefoldin
MKNTYLDKYYMILKGYLDNLELIENDDELVGKLVFIIVNRTIHDKEVSELTDEIKSLEDEIEGLEKDVDYWRDKYEEVTL